MSSDESTPPIKSNKRQKTNDFTAPLNNSDNNDNNDNTRRQSLVRPRKSLLNRKSLTNSNGNNSNNNSNDNSMSSDVDDAAEKRRRRRSFFPPNDDEHRPSPKDKSNNVGSRVARHKLATVAAPADQTPALSMDVMTSNFEEWMKMATDNKINAANTWSFALIDYFADMSLLRNDDNQNSINFQKASCTLDGCVKIWTSRVDSVATEAGKLINGLSVGNNNNKDDDHSGDGVNDEEGYDESDQVTEKVKKRRTPRTGSTLVNDFNSLKAKEFDLEFAVDPLFQKTSADFDEGGAGGLLMNHLGVDGVGRVIFDSSDVAMVEDEEDNDKNTHDPRIDIGELQEKFLPNLDELNDQEICPSLTSFKFSSNLTDQDLQENPFDKPIEENHNEMNFNEFDEDVQMDDNNVNNDDDIGDDFFNSAEDNNQDIIDEGEWQVNPTLSNNAGGIDEDGWAIPENFQEDEQPMVKTTSIQNFNPTSNNVNNNEIVMSMLPMNEDGMFDYFDKTFMKGWAGPEHWGVKRSIKREATMNTNSNKKDKPKEEKVIEKIDFTNPNKSNAKVLFAPPTIKGAGSGSILLPKKQRENEQSDQYLLPDDIHFNSRQLLKLFLKPKVTLRMKSTKVVKGGDENADAAFWSNAANEGFNFDDGDQPPVAPLDSQFFQEDDPDMGDDLVSGEVDAGGYENQPLNEDDALAATHLEKLNRVRPEFVNYSKRAKRVDVRLLKDNIWKGLETNIKNDDDDDEQNDENVNPADSDMKNTNDQEKFDKQSTKKFSSVINGLREAYPDDKLSDISTSFCFICLLHLCNEHNLSLESFAKQALDDDQIEKGQVGSLDMVTVRNLAQDIIGQ